MLQWIAILALALPKDYDQKESWPLLLFLHGSGERGDSVHSHAGLDSPPQDLG